MIRWLVLAFPVLMILSVTGVFQTKVSEPIPLTLFAVVVTMGPGIAYKMNTPIHIMKYVTTFAFAMVFSLFYYDKKFTIRVSVVSYILLVISLYIRSLHVQQIEFETNFMWFFTRSLGFLMESIAGSAQATLQDCNESFRFMDAVRKSMHDLNQNAETLTGNMKQMLEISKETTEIGKLHEVEQEAEKIGALQERSREKTRIAADSSKHTCECGEQLLDMIRQMEDIVKSTIAQADQIVAETQTQKNVTDEVEEAFRHVNVVSENLLQISQAGKEVSIGEGDKSDDETH